MRLLLPGGWAVPFQRPCNVVSCKHSVVQNANADLCCVRAQVKYTAEVGREGAGTKVRVCSAMADVETFDVCRV